jgi:hypothetical protein
MSYLYNIASNSPTSAVRLYRFPYQGERSSARLNLLLHAIVGDIKLIAKAIEDVEAIELDGLGGLFMTEIDSTQLLGGDL